jgi:hypothetical protein
MSDLESLLTPLSAHHLVQMLMHFASKYPAVADEIRDMIAQVRTLVSVFQPAESASRCFCDSCHSLFCGLLRT